MKARAKVRARPGRDDFPSARMLAVVDIAKKTGDGERFAPTGAVG